MNLLYQERGGGNLAFGVSGTWPFAKLEIYDEKIVFKLLWVVVNIPPSAVEYVERVGKIPIIADGVYLKLNGPELPSFVSFFSWGNGQKIKEILDSICLNQKPPRGYFRNPYNIVAFVAWPLVALALLNMLFHFF